MSFYIKAKCRFFIYLTNIKLLCYNIIKKKSKHMDGVNSDEYSSIHYGTAGICSWVPHGRRLCVQVRAGTKQEGRRADLRDERRAQLDAHIPPQEPGTLRETPHAN